MKLHTLFTYGLRSDVELNPDRLVGNLFGDKFIIGEAPFTDRQLLARHHVSRLAGFYRHARLGDHLDHP